MGSRVGVGTEVGVAVGAAVTSGSGVGSRVGVGATSRTGEGVGVGARGDGCSVGSSGIGVCVGAGSLQARMAATAKATRPRTKQFFNSLPTYLQFKVSGGRLPERYCRVTEPSPIAL